MDEDVAQFEGNFVHVNLAHVNGSKLWLLGTASQVHCEKTEPEKVSTFNLGILGENHGRGHFLLFVFKSTHMTFSNLIL